MRWILIVLLMLNAGYLLWAGLEYTHNKQVIELQNKVSDGYGESTMPGGRLSLIKEKDYSKDSATGIISKESVENIKSDLCVLIGPLKDIETGRLLEKRMLALDIHGQLKAIDVTGESDYWVYLKPEISRDLAVSRLRELQEKKIDSFIIPEGQLMNGISLGVFDELGNAEALTRRIAEMGYKPEILANKRAYVENWLAINTEDSIKLSEGVLDQQDIQIARLEIRKEQCSKVASLADIH